MRLTERRTIMLVPTAPFDFDGTAHNPSHFPSQEVAWEPGTRWQTMRWRRRTLGIRSRSPRRQKTTCACCASATGQSSSLGHLSPWEGTIMAHLLFGGPRALRTVERTMRERYGEDRALAFHYLFTDLFWRHRARPIPWLRSMVRL